MLPRQMYAYWHQGADQVPDLVAMNLERWRTLNPGWQLTLLDESDARRVLADSPMDLGAVPITTVADLLRAHLLRDHGGVWVDTTLYPVIPLDQWLPQVTEPAGFFTFDGPQPDRPIVNWFLAAHADSSMMRRLCEEFERYWTRPHHVVKRVGLWPGDSIAAVSPGTEADPAPYFWFHFLFGRLIEVDADFAASWERMPKFSAGPCFKVWRTLRTEGTVGPQRLQRLAGRAPVQKLTLTQVEYPVEALRDLVFTEAPLVPSERGWTPAMAHAVVAPQETGTSRPGGRWGALAQRLRGGRTK
ncbi:MAG: capsular polysaccharide synthesis protein [Nocardioides sp.]